jgi:hypothetical protein
MTRRDPLTPSGSRALLADRASRLLTVAGSDPDALLLALASLPGYPRDTGLCAAARALRAIAIEPGKSTPSDEAARHSDAMAELVECIEDICGKRDIEIIATPDLTEARAHAMGAALGSVMFGGAGE